ncbi:hypothetical protein [Streptomyces sp. Midd1]|uniref:hypothetical protein n=1 Tax=Streptomyces sp. Midd3 TaxID=3161191 RepID=UPI0034DB5C63
MIPSDGTHYVHYEAGVNQHARVLPVIAWDDDGAPLVAGKQKLRKAYELGVVARIRQDNSAVVAAVPGGGWIIDCTDSDGNSWSTPILAWTVHADGTAVPLTSDSDGVTTNATEGVDSYRVYHPDWTELRSQAAE